MVAVDLRQKLELFSKQWHPHVIAEGDSLQEGLRAGHIALSHLPIRLEGDAPGKIDLVRSYYKDIFLLLPGTPAMVLENEAAPRQGSCQGGLP